MSTHVFLTRFNLPANRVERSIFSEAWLRERMRLFERFTVPSVRSQDADRVRWLVFLDHASPEWLRARMTELEAEGLLSPRYLDGPLDPQQLRGFIRAEVAAAGTDDGTLVVTSNLDNDDGLAHNFASRLAALAHEADERPAALYLNTGLIHAGTEVYLRSDASNAFGAVIDDSARDDFATCWDEWHNRLGSLMATHHSDGQPSWLQVIHGRNVSNRVRGRITDPRLHRSTFPGLLDDLDAPARGVALRDTFVRRPVRLVRDEVRGPAARAARQILGTGRFEEFKSRILRRR